MVWVWVDRGLEEDGGERLLHRRRERENINACTLRHTAWRLEFLWRGLASLWWKDWNLALHETDRRRLPIQK